MFKDNFWFVSLTALLVIASVIGWSIPVRVAVAANAVVILLDTSSQARRLYHEHRKKEN